MGFVIALSSVTSELPLRLVDTLVISTLYCIVLLFPPVPQEGKNHQSPLLTFCFLKMFLYINSNLFIFCNFYLISCDYKGIYIYI